MADVTRLQQIAGGGAGDVTPEQVLDAVLSAFSVTAPKQDTRKLAIEALTAAMGTLSSNANRGREQLKIAMAAMTFSEKGAVEAVVGSLGADEGTVVASRVADQNGFTRSTVVNAIRKLESGGILQARSLGVKGTHLKFLYPDLWRFVAVS